MPLIARRFPFGEAKYQSRMVDCYDYHAHDTLVISALAGRGDLVFEFENERFDVKQNTLVCFAPGVRHRAVLSGETRDYAIVHLDPVWIADVYGITVFDRAWRRIVEDEALHDDFVRIVIDLTRTEESDSQELEEWLWCFLDEALDGMREGAVPNAQLEAVRKKIASAWDKPLSLEALAEAFGINRYTLIRQFKHHYGSTPKKYQLDLRVHYAKAMIVDGMDIAEAALSCGFYDQSHLYNYFKKIFGVSPKAYQEAFRS